MSRRRQLRLEDILDLRAYERERVEYRERIMALKAIRRVAIGPIITLVFENAETMRFQVQEMARAERMVTDRQIQNELDAYNPLIPQPGQLSATLFVELSSKEDLQHWLPRLVGIERAVRLRVGDPPVTVEATPEEAHAAQLTREDVTASVHYVRFELDSAQVEAFRSGPGPLVLAIDHPSYREEALLGPETRASLAEDLVEP